MTDTTAQTLKPDAPERIWLTNGDIGYEDEFDHETFLQPETSWCQHRLHKNDVEYVRLDVADAEREALQRELSDAALIIIKQDEEREALKVRVAELELLLRFEECMDDENGDIQLMKDHGFVEGEGKPTARYWLMQRRKAALAATASKGEVK